MTTALPVPERQRGAALWLLGLGALVFLLYFRILQEGYPSLWSDTYEYADVARSIAAGEGIVAHSATVMEVWMLGPGHFPLPYLFHDVGHSLLMALFFRVFGASETTIGWTSGAFFVLLPCLTFLVGLRVLRSRRSALLAAVLVLINAQLLSYSTTGLSELPYAFVLTLLLGMLYETPQPRDLVLAGLAYGVLVTLRSNAMPFLPLIALYLWSDVPGTGAEEAAASTRRSAAARARLARLLPFLAGLALILAPNMLRTYRYLGRPIGTVASAYMPVFYTSAIEGKSKTLFSQPGLDVAPVRFLLEHPGELWWKVRYQLGDTVARLVSGGGLKGNWADAIQIFLFLFGALVAPQSETRRQRRFRWLVYGLVLMALAAGSVFHLRWCHLYGFLPIVMVYNAELVNRLGGPGAAGLRACAGFVALLLAFGMARVWLVERSPGDSERVSHERYHDALGKFMARKTPADAVVLTKVDGLGELRALGWYSGRQIVELSDYTLAKLRDVRQPLYVMLASDRPSGKDSALDAPPGFVQVKRWESDMGSGVLYGRR